MVIKINYLFFLLLIGFGSCQSNSPNDSVDKSTNSKTSNKTTQMVNFKENKVRKKIDFSNPALLNTGTDIGNTFKAYYLTGSIDKMIELTSQETIEKYGLENLKESYVDLDYGFDMNFYNMTQDSSSYLLMYKCNIQATKVKKVLKVVVENDSAKILPSDPLNKKIFQ